MMSMRMTEDATGVDFMIAIYGQRRVRIGLYAYESDANAMPRITATINPENILKNEKSIELQKTGVTTSFISCFATSRGPTMTMLLPIIMASSCQNNKASSTAPGFKNLFRAIIECVVRKMLAD